MIDTDGRGIWGTRFHVREFFVGVLIGISLTAVVGTSRSFALEIPPTPNFPHGFAENILCVVFDTVTGFGAPIPPLSGGICPPGSVVTQCSDGIDNDGDGKVDLADPGCSSASDTSETDPITPPPPPSSPACSDLLDNDSDGLIDLADPGCSDTSDTDEANGGGGGGAPLACADGLDNDNDGAVDLADPGCSDASDNDETDAVTPPSPSPSPSGGGGGGTPAVCADGIDNDSDGTTDLNDPGCSSSSDTSEVDEGQGGGGPISGALAVGGGSGGGGGGGGGPLPPAPAVLGTTTEDCSQYLNTFIKPGAQNDPSQVTRLQQFLNQSEGASLAVNGVYDLPTITAVNVFQLKYASEVLTPWGITNATGYVYLTTRKKVNELYCKGLEEFPLTPAQEAEVRTYRETKVLPSEESPEVPVLLPQAPAAPDVAPPPSPEPAPAEAPAPAPAFEVGETEGESQIAAPVGAEEAAPEDEGFVERLWRGIRGWFR